MRRVVLAVAFVFTAVLGFLTLVVMFNSGPDVLTVTSLLVIALFALGIFGALGAPPGDR